MTCLGVLHVGVLPRLRDVAVVPEDGAVVEPQLALLGVLEETKKNIIRTCMRTLLHFDP